MSSVVVPIRKTSPEYNQDIRVRQIDELFRISMSARDAFYGPNWFNQVRDFYNLNTPTGPLPSFRPKVNIPQLQVLCIAEATDLSDSSPRVYLADRNSGKRNQQRERAFQEYWKSTFVNYYLMHGILWSQLSGIGWAQIGSDPTADDGLGSVWVRYRDPATVHVDPSALSTDDWCFAGTEDRMYPDRIRGYWPETGRDIYAAPYTIGNTAAQQSAGGGYGFRLPDGPMQLAGGPVGTDLIQGDGRTRVRTMFIYDSTIELVRDVAGSKAQDGLESIYRKAYPNGRVMIDAAGKIVADGDNPTPRGTFPLVPIYGLPPLTNFLPPPPIRFSKDLQDLAGRMYTSLFENAVRVNNAVWFIDENTGITTEAFGGLPGEVCVINNNSRIPEIRWPSPMPEHFVALPQLLLNLQKELQGFSPSREGSPGAGNLSPELFEASIFQSKRLTRCRARLLARSVSQIARLFYDYMNTTFVTDRNIFSVGDTFEAIRWDTSDDSAQNLQLFLDPTSLLPISQAALRTMAPLLRQTGALDVRSFLEMLEIPNAGDIADRLQIEAQLVALSRLRKR